MGEEGGRPSRIARPRWASVEGFPSVMHADICKDACSLVDRTPVQLIEMTIVNKRTLRIGIDCGGTNTDAVVVDLSPGAPKVILATTKTPTTPEVTLGIQTAITRILDALSDGDRDDIQAVSIGTTHFVNALIQRSADCLSKVAVIRLCGPFSRNTPPFAGFPYELRDLLEGPHFFVDGGLQIDGSEIAPVSHRVETCKLRLTVLGECSRDRACLRTTAKTGICCRNANTEIRTYAPSPSHPFMPPSTLRSSKRSKLRPSLNDYVPTSSQPAPRPSQTSVCSNEKTQPFSMHRYCILPNLRCTASGSRPKSSDCLVLSLSQAMTVHF